MNPEARDLSLNAMKKWIAILVISIVIAVGGVTVVYGRRVLLSQVNESKAAAIQKFPKPRLENEPRQDLYVLRARENKILTSYSNQGLKAGTVQVPIDRAMEEMAK